MEHPFIKLIKSITNDHKEYINIHSNYVQRKKQKNGEFTDKFEYFNDFNKLHNNKLKIIQLESKNVDSLLQAFIYLVLPEKRRYFYKYKDNLLMKFKEFLFNCNENNYNDNELLSLINKEFMVNIIICSSYTYDDICSSASANANANINYTLYKYNNNEFLYSPFYFVFKDQYNLYHPIECDSFNYFDNEYIPNLVDKSKLN
jgi:hypothetical protein